jgi:D-cysteine desulfhydrase
MRHAYIVGGVDAAWLDRHPRLFFTRTPTPLDDLEHLSRRLGVKVSLKRDDLTDLALGGDKPRKLEYELARPEAAAADWLVGCGSSQSNFARLLTAAARRLGMGCSLVLARGDHPDDQGNLLVVRLMGADVRVVDVDDIWNLEEHCQDLCEQLRAGGHRPYYVPVSGTTPESCLGYVRAGYELADQLAERDQQPAALYVPFGTGGIAVGLALGLRERGLPFPIIASSVNRPAPSCADQLDHLAPAVAALIGSDVGDLGIEIRDDQLGRGYGKPTDACLDAIVTFAQIEGVLLDPVYSGKVAATLLADCHARRWPPGTHIMMLHSGGSPAIFAYQQELADHLLSVR